MFTHRLGGTVSLLASVEIRTGNVDIPSCAKEGMVRPGSVAGFVGFLNYSLVVMSHLK